MNRRALALRSLAAAALALALALPSTTRADDNADTAAELFRTASAAFARGEYRAAAIGFEEANRRVSHAATLYNAALAWSAAGDKARAAGALRAALAAPGLTPEKEREIRGRLEPLEAELGRVRVEGPAGARVSLAHVQGGPLPALIHVLPGDHEVAIERADGTREVKRVSLAAGQERVVAFATARAPLPPPPPSAPSLPPPGEAPGRTQRVLGWVGIGGAVAAFGVGVGLGVSALEARDEFVNGGRLDVEGHDRADELRTWTNVVWAGAGVLGVAGVALLVTAPRAAAVTSALRLGPGAAEWELRF
jgi:hypothetical protein